MSIQRKWLLLAAVALLVQLPVSAAWFSGGSFDGYDRLTQAAELRSIAGTMFLFR